MSATALSNELEEQEKIRNLINQLREIGTSIIEDALKDAQTLCRIRLSGEAKKKLYSGIADPVAELEEFAKEGIFDLAEGYCLSLSHNQISAISGKILALVEQAKAVRAEHPYKLTMRGEYNIKPRRITLADSVPQLVALPHIQLELAI